MRALVRFSVDRPWWAIALCLLVVAVLGSGAAQLRFSDDIRVFFDEGNPQLATFEAHQNTYAPSDHILFVFASKTGNIFTRENLTTLSEITREAWQIPFSRRVDSLTNFQHTYAVGDELVVEDLVEDPASLTGDRIAAIRRIALAEPTLVNRLISAKGHTAGLNVPITLPRNDPLTEQPQAVAYARRLVAEAEAANPDLTVHLTGLTMINNALAEEGRDDFATLVPVMFVVVLLVVGVLLRSLAGSVTTLTVILLSVVTAMGLAGWMDVVLSPPVISAANIIMTIAVADCVHLLVTFYQHLRSGQSKRAALIESLEVNRGPILMTSVTTALGFLSMNFSDSPPFRDLGTIVAMGVIAAWILSMVLLPAMITVLPIKAAPASGKALAGVMDRLAGFVANRRRVLLATMLPIVGLSVLALPRNELNDEFVKYFDEELPFRVATDFLVENLTGFEFIEYSLESGKPGGIYEPAYLRSVATFADWYRQQPETRHVYAITDILRRLNKNMHGDASAWYRLPDDPELAAQYVLLYELSLPFGLDLTDQIDLARSATMMRVNLGSITTNGMLDLERRAEAWLRSNAADTVRGVASGQPLMFAHIGYRNVRGLLLGTVIALLLISGMLILAFRSLKFGAISLVPNLVPAAIGFGLWGVFVGEVGLAISVVVGMTLGIIVDDTVHMMSKYLYARRQMKQDPEAAVRFAFSHVGTAMCVTSIALVAGFGVLGFSDFELNAGMAILSAITITAALIADFLLLPPLLVLLDK